MEFHNLEVDVCAVALCLCLCFRCVCNDTFSCPCFCAACPLLQPVWSQHSTYAPANSLPVSSCQEDKMQSPLQLFMCLVLQYSRHFVLLRISPQKRQLQLGDEKRKGQPGSEAPSNEVLSMNIEKMSLEVEIRTLRFATAKYARSFGWDALSPAGRRGM